MMSPLKSVALAAIEEVRPGMLIGLGTGRAAEAFVDLLAERQTAGLKVEAISTSVRTSARCAELGIPLVSFTDRRIDVAFDGADEVAPDGSLIKGLGGAMLRERVVANYSRRFIVLVTEEKRVTALGERCPLPVEVVPFAAVAVTTLLEERGLSLALRKKNEATVVTDNGNWVLDVTVGGHAPRALDAWLHSVPGVVETGFFFDLASRVIVGGADVVSLDFAVPCR